MKKRKLSLALKIDLVFAVLIIPFLVWEGVSLRNNIRQAETDISADVSSKMNLFFENLEEEISRMTVEATAFYAEKETMALATDLPQEWDYELVSAINRIQSRRRSMESISNCIRYVQIYVPSVGKMMQTDVVFGGDTEDISLDQAREAGRDTVYGHIVIENGELVVGYPYKVNQEIIMLVKFGLSNAVLKRELENTLPDDAEYLFTDLGEGFTLTNSSSMAEAEGTEEEYELLRDDLGLRLKVQVDNAEKVAAYRTFIRTTAAFVLLYLFIVLFFTVFTWADIRKPLKTLMDGFGRTETGNFTERLDHERATSREFRYLYDSYNSMNRSLENLFQTVYEQDLLLKESELKQLQTQISPHFLYNTLFLLNHLIQEEELEEAALLSKELGTYYRYITRNAAETVTLSEESEHALIYSDIQKARFEDRVEIEYKEVPEEIRDFKVPRLIIQPVLENAYRYGLEGKARDGKLRVSFFNDETRVSVFVEDNGSSLTDEDIEKIRKNFEAGKREDGEITGIINIHKRIRGIFGEDSGLIADRSPLGGLRIEIRMRRKEDAQTSDRG